MCNKFIDISEHNAILSYGGVATSNLKGVIIKATEGTTFIDHALETHYDGLNGSIALGFYHYLTSTSSPQTQAQNFWNQIKDKNYQIIPVLDVEQDSLGDNTEDYTNQFIEEFYKLSDQNMIIYSGRCFIEEHFSNSFKDENLWWVADYSANECPSINNCHVVGWQFTEDSASYAFALGDLDCSILEDEDHFYLSSQIPYSEYRTNTTDYESIEYLQTQLNIQGFTDSNGNKLNADGVAGELTLSACPIVKEGATGTITQWIQEHLHTALNCDLSDDGIFGEQTRQAVITYQENMSLDGDGVVGKNTWSKLLGM